MFPQSLGDSTRLMAQRSSSTPIGRAKVAPRSDFLSICRAKDTSLRNATFPHAWRYRNYVIQALNEDKPYDRFIAEQVAGDLLPADSPEERANHLVATGFVSPAHRAMLVTAASPDDLLSGFASYQAPLVGKWVETSQT